METVFVYFSLLTESATFDLSSIVIFSENDKDFLKNGQEILFTLKVRQQNNIAPETSQSKSLLNSMQSSLPVVFLQPPSLWTSGSKHQRERRGAVCEGQVWLYAEAF